MKLQALDIGHLPTAPSSKLLSRSSVWKMRNSMDRTDTRQRMTRLLFLLFRIVCDACVTQRAFASRLSPSVPFANFIHKAFVCCSGKSRFAALDVSCRFDIHVL